MKETEEPPQQASPSPVEDTLVAGESTVLKKREMPAILRKLQGRAHWFAPNLIPVYRRDAECERRLDRESNEESSVPEDTELRVRALWGVEVFGPNESERLYEALKRLNWSAGGIGTEGGGAMAWVQQQRSYGWGGNYNVGLVVRHGQKRKFLGVSNQAEMPDGVDYLLVRIHQICPAVTCLVVCFVLDGEAMKRYEHELNLERRTRLRRGARWWVTHLSPSHIKQESIAAVRSDLRRSICDWFDRTIPGYFATSRLARSLPFAELLCTANDDVFSTPPLCPHFDWRRILVNPAKHEIWTQQSTTPLRFVLNRSLWPEELRNFLVAGLSLSSLSAEQLQMYGGTNGVVHICNEELDGLLPFVAASAYLEEISCELKLAREELRLSKSRGKTLRSIKRIQQFFDRSAGVPTAAREICKFVERPGVLKFYCGSFTAPNLGKETTERDFAEELRRILHHTASNLLEDESSTREHFEQLSSVLSIRESIGAQRRMELLTVAAILVAGLSLAAAWPEHWDTKIKSWSGKAEAFIEMLRPDSPRPVR